MSELRARMIRWQIVTGVAVAAGIALAVAYLVSKETLLVTCGFACFGIALFTGELERDAELLLERIRCLRELADLRVGITELQALAHNLEHHRGSDE